MEGAAGHEARGLSKGSSKEIKSPEHASDVDAGSSRRYYDCIFCKRGFPTAQALGGHMNIHRKDRGRPKKPNPAAPAPFLISKEPCVEGLIQSSATYYHPYTGHGQLESRSVGGGRGMMRGPAYAAGASSRRPQELCLFWEPLDLSLGMHGDFPRMEVIRREGVMNRDHGGGHELDLELRLGH